MTLEIILRAVFGLDQGPRLNQLRDLLTDVLRFSESPLSVLPAVRRWARWVPAMRRFEKVSAATDRMLREVIEERRAEGESDRDDVLAMLLTARHEDGSPMSDEELRDELLTALVAGHETTASQLAWAFEQLAREPRGRRPARRRGRRRRQRRVPDRDRQRDPAAQAGPARTPNRG